MRHQPARKRYEAQAARTARLHQGAGACDPLGPQGTVRRPPAALSERQGQDWLLWLQGWHSCPKLVKDVRTSWYFHNSANAWNILELDSSSVGEYVELSDRETRLHPAAQSDLIRLRLLSRYGGVWADATMLCMRPLDDWIEDALPPTSCGFWMYHGRDKARGPASWFMVSKKGSYLVDTWCNAATNYWRLSRDDNEYFWMDRLFAQIIKSNSRFMQEWHSVRFLDCEAPLQAHCLARREFESFDCGLRVNLLFTLALDGLKNLFC